MAKYGGDEGRRETAYRKVAEFSGRLESLEQSVRLLTKRVDALDKHVVALSALFDQLLDLLKSRQ